MNSDFPLWLRTTHVLNFVLIKFAPVWDGGSPMAPLSAPKGDVELERAALASTPQ